jgi:hypothetical protein
MWASRQVRTSDNGPAFDQFVNISGCLGDEVMWTWPWKWNWNKRRVAVLGVRNGAR